MKIKLAKLVNINRVKLASGVSQENLERFAFLVFLSTIDNALSVICLAFAFSNPLKV